MLMAFQAGEGSGASGIGGAAGVLGAVTGGMVAADTLPGIRFSGVLPGVLTGVAVFILTRIIDRAVFRES